MTPPAHADLVLESEPDDVPEWLVPGPLVRKLMLLALLAVVLAGTASAWLVSRASEQEALRRVVSQQSDEVEVVARLLGSKIEQSQRVLGSVAEGITPALLESPSSLEWLLQQGLPAVRFFDAMQVARQDGQLSVNLQYGRMEKASSLEPAERDYLLRTMVDGKPLVSGLIGTRANEARVMFTMPLHRSEGGVMGAVAGVLRLQSQGLLPQSMALPARDDSRLIVFTRDGVILSHPQLERVMGHVRDEPGLAAAYERWQRQEQPLSGRSFTDVASGHIVSIAGMPLPQWMVARVSDSSALLAPLEGSQRRAWWAAAAGVAVIGLLTLFGMGWLARPLAQLRERAQRMVQGEPQHARDPWPSALGEVDALVQVCTHMLAQQSQQRSDAAVMAGQLQSILEHAPVGIAITRGGLLEVLSLQASRMLGYGPTELQGRNARQVHASDEDHARAARRVREEFSAHGGFDGELRFLRKDGSAVWARVLGRKAPRHGVASGTVWILEDVTAAREARQLQGWLAGHDPLTQLLNRGAFCHRLQELVSERVERSRAVPVHQEGEEAHTLVVLFMDLDHFTVVNDVAGHDAGDDVLRHVARMIEELVRNVGWAARLGGDEFGVVLPSCSRSRGAEIAELIRSTLSAWEPAYQGRSFLVSASIGMVVMEPGLHDVMQLLRSADMACYEAKRRGRNQVFRDRPG